MAYIFNLYLDQGSDYSYDVQLTDNNGDILPLVGYEVYAQFRKSYGSNTVYNFIVTVTDVDNGIINLFFAAEDSMLIQSGIFVYDIKIFNTDTTYTLRVIEGELLVSPGVTSI